MKRKLCFDQPSTWVRGSLLGRGGFCSVHLAVVPQKRKYKLGSLGDERVPTAFAVKSASPPECYDLSGEERFLDELADCPHIIRSFGNSITVNDNGGGFVFNLFLEYASGGTLLDLVRRGEIGLPEPEVRRHARSVLMGVEHIHRLGFVHCDLKPENVLLVADSGRFVAKIGDFGLAKRAGEGFPVKGTRMYLSPEAAVHGVQEAPADIWAFGCVVLQLVTGNRPWRLKSGWNGKDLVDHIGSEGNYPAVPTGLSEIGRDFLGRCFARNPRMRWTAKQLLTHPFVAELEVTVGIQTKDLAPECDFLGAAAKRRRISGNGDDVIVISSN